MYSQLKFLSIWDNALLKIANRVRKVTDNPGGNPIKEGNALYCLIGVYCDFCVFCIIEITCLVFFILDFSDINLAQKIIYFFHWILIPYLYIMGKCLSY